MREKNEENKKKQFERKKQPTNKQTMVTTYIPWYHCRNRLKTNGTISNNRHTKAPNVYTPGTYMSGRMSPKLCSGVCFLCFVQKSSGTYSIHNLRDCQAARGREEEAGGMQPMTWGWNVDED